MSRRSSQSRREVGFVAARIWSGLSQPPPCGSYMHQASFPATYELNLQVLIGSSIGCGALISALSTRPAAFFSTNTSIVSPVSSLNEKLSSPPTVTFGDVHDESTVTTASNAGK